MARKNVRRKIVELFDNDHSYQNLMVEDVFKKLCTDGEKCQLLKARVEGALGINSRTLLKTLSADQRMSLNVFINENM